MKLADILRAALHGLRSNRMRSALTMLGISIGVGAVILLIAVGNGSAVAIQERLQSLGTNTLTVSANAGGGMNQTQSSSQTLSLELAEKLADPQTAPDVLTVSPVASTSTRSPVAASASTTACGSARPARPAFTVSSPCRSVSMKSVAAVWNASPAVRTGWFSGGTGRAAAWTWV